MDKVTAVLMSSVSGFSSEVRFGAGLMLHSSSVPHIFDVKMYLL